ncbi:MAG: hypothetical protein HY726_22550 [Candidatus Rokubacteria bacterium]|nr:hypothetical protein [Candidatus Rokubacteria bacterium]
MSEGSPASVVSVDLGWSESTRGRNAAAFLTRAGRIRFEQSLPNANPALAAWVRGRVAAGGTVLLDIPIGGGDHLAATGKAFREIDGALQGAGLPLYPSSRAVGRGGALSRLLPGYRVREIYPYAILRVLWALHETGRLASAIGGSDGAWLDASAWRVLPPRYKRGTPGVKRRGLEAIHGLLTSRALALPFELELPRPVRGVSLAALSDLYDACLGLVPAWLAARHGMHPMVGIAAGRHGEALLLLADAWLRARLGRSVRWVPFRVE